MIKSGLSVAGLKLPVVFEHYTEVPGLGDSIRHLDGFLAICNRFDALFLRRPFKNARSSIGDFNVSDAIGLSGILDELSRSASQQVTSGRLLECELDFNAAISGESDGIKGSMLVRDKTIQELYVNLEDAIVSSVCDAMRAELGTVDDSVGGVPYDAIKVRFAIRGTSLITRFSDGGLLSPYTKRTAQKIFAVTDDSIRVVIHLRRGDITIFPYQGRFIASWGDFRKPDNRSALPEIIDSPEGSVYQNYSIDPYAELVSRIAGRVDRPVKLTFISDGFSRGVDRVRKYAEHLGLSDGGLLEIEESARAMEDDLLMKLAQMSDSCGVTFESYIGEDGDKFVKSFESIASADVLLYSSGSFSKTTFNFFNYRNGIALGPCTYSSIDSQFELVADSLR